MAKVQQKQVERITFASQAKKDVLAMDCGAFVDFFTDKTHKGRVLDRPGNTIIEKINSVDDSQDIVIQAPACGLKCNMIFGVNLDPKVFDEKKFTDKEFKKCILEALVECFKNCVDSVVINCGQVRNLLPKSIGYPTSLL